MNPLRILLLATVILVVFGTDNIEADEISLEWEGSHHLGGGTMGVEVSGDYAYVTNGKGIEVIDISNSTNLKRVTDFETPGGAYSIDLVGDYAYVTDYDQGLAIIDISDLTNIQEVGRYELYSSNYARDVEVIGDYAYVADFYSGLLIIDISDPTNPQKVGDYDTGYAVALTVLGDYAYIAGAESQFIILDVSEPTDPQLVKNYDSNSASVLYVEVDGDYAYLGETGSDQDIIDISDPANPQLVATYEIFDTVFDLKVIGDYLYVAGGQEGFFIVDISDPTDPQIVGEYNDSFGQFFPKASAIFVSGEKAYLGKGTDGLLIIDISQSDNPEFLGRLATGDVAWDIHISGYYAYIANGRAGLLIMNISNPINPQYVSRLSTDDYAVAVTVRDGYAFVGDREGGFKIIDVSDPYNPHLASNYETESLAYRVLMVEDYAYIANIYSGLLILDISNPESPQFVGDCDTGDQAYDIAIKDEHAYIADYNGGLVIVDISDPSEPYEIANYDTDGRATRIRIVEDYAYLVVVEDGLIIVDISDPTDPKLVKKYEPNGTPWDFKVVNDYAYLSYFDTDPDVAGVMILNVSDSSNPEIVGNYENSTSESYFYLEHYERLEESYVYVTSQNNWEIDILKILFNPYSLIESIQPSSIRVGNEVSFIGSGYDPDGTVVIYEWKSSINGFLSYEKEFSTNNLDVGTHTISLRVKDDDDLWSDWYNSQLLVNPNAAPEAIIDSIIPSPVRFDQEVIFSGNGTDSDGTVVAYQWKSSIDGELSTEQSFSLTGLSIGLHNISFKVQDNDGLWSTWNTTDLTVSPNSAPDAIIISITPSPARFDSEITFVGNGTDIDGTIASYEWESSIDGLLGSEKEFSVSGLSIGEHIIRLRVRDNDGAWSDWIMSEQSYNFIISGNSVPIALIDSILPSPSELGSEVIFSGRGFDSDGSILEYFWISSIEGNLSTEGNFSLDSLSLGTHNVTLRVKDNDGSWSETTSTIILIYSAPMANAGDDLIVERSTLIQFTGSGISEGSSIVLYEWDFDGDGMYDWSSDQNGILNYFYNKEGNYEAALRVTDTNGMTATDTIIITVIAKGANTAELEKNEGPETEDPGIPSISLITSIILVGLLAIFRRK